MPDAEVEEEWLSEIVEDKQNNLKIPLAAVRMVGPAAQTLGAVLKISGKSTFVQQQAIASVARLPLDTCRKHLAKLQPDWLVNEGRQAARGKVRKTTTFSPTNLAKESARQSYILLPDQMLCSLQLTKNDAQRSSSRLNWSEKVLFGYALTQYVKLSTTEEGQANNFYSDSDFYRFSLSKLTRETGLDRKTIIRCKDSLHRLGLIAWSGSDDGDILHPNVACKVVTEPAKKAGFVYLSIKTG